MKLTLDAIETICNDLTEDNAKQLREQIKEALKAQLPNLNAQLTGSGLLPINSSGESENKS